VVSPDAPEVPEVSDEEIFWAFLAEQQLGETGLFSIPYVFDAPYGDDYIAVMPGAVDLEDAVYSANIVDIDEDGNMELLVIRSTAVPDAFSEDLYDTLHIDVYELEDGQVVLSDTAQLGTHAIANRSSRGFADVFLAGAETGWYIGLDSFNTAHYNVDGMYWEILLYKYDGHALICVYENYWAGSYIAGDDDDIRESFQELMNLGIFPDGTLPYLSDEMEVDFNHHRITAEGENVDCLLKIESWDVYSGRFLFDRYLGIDASDNSFAQSIYDVVEESIAQNEVLVEDDLCLISDESDLFMYIGVERRVVTAA